MQEAATRSADAARQVQAADTEATATADQAQQLRDRLNQDASGDATVAATAVAAGATLQAHLAADRLETRVRSFENVHLRRFADLTYESVNNWFSCVFLYAMADNKHHTL
jgi:hypothetical protein